MKLETVQSGLGVYASLPQLGSKYGEYI